MVRVRLLTSDMQLFRLCGEDLQREPGKCDKDGVPLPTNAGADGKVPAGDKGAAAPNALPTDTANVGIVLDTYAIMCIMDNGLDDLLLDIGDVVKSVVCARLPISER